jgi:hypothetical protein
MNLFGVFICNRQAVRVDGAHAALAPLTEAKDGRAAEVVISCSQITYTPILL